MQAKVKLQFIVMFLIPNFNCRRGKFLVFSYYETNT